MHGSTVIKCMMLGGFSAKLFYWNKSKFGAAKKVYNYGPDLKHNGPVERNKNTKDALGASPWAKAQVGVGGAGRPWRRLGLSKSRRGAGGSSSWIQPMQRVNAG